jgi:hypothetical protein
VAGHDECGYPAVQPPSIVLVFETVQLFWIVRKRLRLHVLAFGKHG